MKIIDPSVSIMNPPDYQQMLKHIEAAGRTCYKSEGRITDDSAAPFIKRIIESGHNSVLEHFSLSCRFIVDRGVSHELVRHRLCSFSQESTRYCNYSGEKFGRELTFIRPMFWESSEAKYSLWYELCLRAEDFYLKLLDRGASPQEARSVLPNSTKTEIVVTANIREWRLIFSQRCAKDAHPQMRQATIPLLGWCIDNYYAFFGDMFKLWIDGVKHFESKNWQLAEVGVE